MPALEQPASEGSESLADALVAGVASVDAARARVIIRADRPEHEIWLAAWTALDRHDRRIVWEALVGRLVGALGPGCYGLRMRLIVGDLAMVVVLADLLASDERAALVAPWASGGTDEAALADLLVGPRTEIALEPADGFCPGCADHPSPDGALCQACAIRAA